MQANDYLGRSRLLGRLKTGPYGPHVKHLATRLVDEGHTRQSTRRYLSVISGLLGWLARRRCELDGGRLSADSVQSLLAKHVRAASKKCPSLKSKRVSPHVLRHTAAMELLQAGVDCSVIALWLGHESIETTQVHLHAHLALKEAALAKLKPYERGERTRFRPNDRLLEFLDAL